jgi:hypothetical protein
MLHVSANLVAVLREMHRKNGYIDRPHTFVNHCTGVRYHVLTVLSTVSQKSAVSRHIHPPQYTSLRMAKEWSKQYMT